MSESSILSIVTRELDNALSFDSESDSSDMEKALDYYKGKPNGKEVQGKSSVTSTDVADAIEWIKPQIIKALTQNNQVVTFDPVGPEDELQAQLETEYVYHVLMKENNGFVAIHEFVMGALLHRNGILKVYYNDDPKTKITKYTGLSEEQVNMVAIEPKTKILSAEQDELGAYDIKVERTISNGNIVVESVPLEEFRISSRHNSIDLKDARFIAHVTSRTISDLIKEGYPKDKIKMLPGYDDYLNYFRFKDQDSTNHTDNSGNESEKELSIAECYIWLDLDGDGVSEYVKVTIGGISGSYTLLNVEEISYNPWIATTPIIMAHNFTGMSIYDRLKEIQDQKTAILRNVFDNFYIQNNKRYKVIEGRANIDDLTTSRAGGVVRVKSMDAIEAIETLPIGGDAFSLMEYLDGIRAGRTGVSSDGSAAPQNIGDRIGSQGVNQLMTAKEELVGLIVRVIAETGIKPLCTKIQSLARMHIDVARNFKFRDQWTQINPSTWDDRSYCTVRVGTGSGDVTAKTAALTTVMGIQEKIMSTPQQALVEPEKIFSALDDFCRFSGLISAHKYFIDPSSDKGKQMMQQNGQAAQQEKQIRDQMELELAKSQLKLADAEMAKAQAQMTNVNLTAQMNAMRHKFEIEKADMKNQIDISSKMIDTKNKEIEMQFKYDDMENKTAIELTRIEAQMNTEEDKNYAQNKTIVEGNNEQ